MLECLPKSGRQSGGFCRNVFKQVRSYKRKPALSGATQRLRGECFFKRHSKKTTATHYAPNSKGFSLIECIVGMFLVAVLLMSVVVATPNLRQIVIKSEIAKMGNSLGNNKIEYFRTMSYADIQGNLLPKSPIEEETIVNGITYKLVTKISPYSMAGINTEAVSVEVSVNWTTHTGHQQTTTNWTIFTRNGLSDKQFIQTS